MQRINISIVIYKTPKADLLSAIQSVFQCKEYNCHLYLIDNSPTDEMKDFVKDFPQVSYEHHPENPGYGRSHNIAIRQSIKDGVPYHFILNPDIQFYTDVLSDMVKYMEENSAVGMMMPKVLNRDGSMQYLPKLLPKPFGMFLRKMKGSQIICKKFLERYELRGAGTEQIYETPVISGCFTLLRVSALREVGLYDERYFLYFEDWDLSRRMHRRYRTLYYPLVQVYHGYEGGSRKSAKLFFIHLKSMISYFNKWGWFFDNERRRINKATLKQVSSQ